MTDCTRRLPLIRSGLFIASTLVVGVSPAPLAQSPPARVPVGECSGAEDKLWKAAEDTLGIFVTDAQRAIGGAVGAKKYDDARLIGRLGNRALGGYHPVSGFKQMACGTLDKWTLYKLGNVELDLHPHVKLARDYKHLIDELPMPRGQAGDTCYRAELPRRSLRVRPEEAQWRLPGGALAADVWMAHGARVHDDAVGPGRRSGRRRGARLSAGVALAAPQPTPPRRRRGAPGHQSLSPRQDVRRVRVLPLHEGHDAISGGLSEGSLDLRTRAGPISGGTNRLS